MKVIDVDTVRRVVSFEHLIEPVAESFIASSAGRAQNDLLVLYPQASPEAGDMYVKTATVQDEPIFVVKVSPWFKVNGETRVPQGGFLAVFNACTGHTLAILDEQHYLSDIRTAAAGRLRPVHWRPIVFQRWPSSVLVFRPIGKRARCTTNGGLRSCFSGRVIRPRPTA